MAMPTKTQLPNQCGRIGCFRTATAKSNYCGAHASQSMIDYYLKAEEEYSDWPPPTGLTEKIGVATMDTGAGEQFEFEIPALDAIELAMSKIADAVQQIADAQDYEPRVKELTFAYDTEQANQLLREGWTLRDHTIEDFPASGGKDRVISRGRTVFIFERYEVES